jgi:hypothetical protein
VSNRQVPEAREVLGVRQDDDGVPESRSTSSERPNVYDAQLLIDWSRTLPEHRLTLDEWRAKEGR